MTLLHTKVCRKYIYVLFRISSDRKSAKQWEVIAMILYDLDISEAEARKYLKL